MGQDYVKGGGTSSGAQDQRRAIEREEAKKRQQYHDSVKRVAAAEPDNSRLYSRKMGGLNDSASIVLKVENSDRTLVGYLACDLIAAEHDGAPAWSLVVPCPRCYWTHGRLVKECSMTIHSWHRGFSLDDKHAGTLWVSPIGKEGDPREAYTLAGSVHTHETITCPLCAYRFEIGPARLDANEPPCSGAIRSA